ncbi:MAG: ATP-binding protein [bacterium]
MLMRISLRSQIYLILTSLILIVIIGGLTIIWYSKQMENITLHIIDRDLVRYQITEKMDTALVHQKGYVTYFYLDRDPGWLQQLGIYRQIFKERLDEITLLADTESQERAVADIATQYSQYITLINQVIAYYKNGELEKGAQLHEQVRNRFFRILKASEAYKAIQTNNVKKSWQVSRSQASRLIASVGITAGVVLVLVLFLILLLTTRILDPLQALLMEGAHRKDQVRSRDEVRQLSDNVHDLMETAGHAQEELKQSRAILMQSEKLALVGKLAAGMAHSIRNPLTSVKMRLFSLGRTLDLSESQKEDFDVIAEEIRHLDIIVQNFLEFSRPPKMTMQSISPSAVVDQSLQLLEHRLKSYNVTVTVDRTKELAAIQCDPEQLKEVFVNLIVNACEAMKTGGEIEIEETEINESESRKVVISITDNGPGIPESIINHIFQPFFSTKDEGTGLGLSIASRIVSDHGGKLDVSSLRGQGTTFILTFPMNGV